MGRVSTRSNPTNLKDIDKRCVGITLGEENGRRSFSVSKLDFADLELDGHLQVVCIARAGSTSQRFPLGTITNWRKDPLVLEDVDPSAPLQFRVFVHDDSPRLVAAAERVRLRDQGQAESLLPMEPADLGQEIWRLIFSDDGPILQYNATVFPSASGVENYFPFRALVLPEALRRVMEYIAQDPPKLDDDSDPISAWRPWLDELGVALPDEGDVDWPQQVVSIFCDRHLFASKFTQHLQGPHDD
ncbi:MAG: hypothetical protein ABI972_16625 [Acidobacteriota bacterium]